MSEQKTELEKMLAVCQRLKDSDRVLIGIGGEWKQNPDKKQIAEIVSRPEVDRAYEALYELIKDKDYFIVTTVTDGKIWEQPFDSSRIVAPCGNINWRQCEAACTKDIWELGEIPDGKCPHCGAELIPNTVENGHYIEEGYLPQWKAYTEWLARTLNKKLTVLELGEGFRTPTVIRWPFEKTVFFNKKAWFYRVHHEFYQISGDLKEKAEGVEADSVSFICRLAECCREEKHDWDN